MPHHPSPRHLHRSASAAGRLVLTCVVLLALTDCAEPIVRQTVEVVRTLPHDTTAYTQGLLLHHGCFYESTGQYGSSTLREVDVETGEVLRMVEIPEEYFGEGLARVGSRLIQLTWREGRAFVYDLETFELVETIEYRGQGWGLCHDGEALYMTTGGSQLVVRDPESFEELERIRITRGGRAMTQVNELACVGEHIYGNLYPTDRIVRIDKATGEVVGEIDASGLVREGGRPPDRGAVLNGIAHDPQTDTFYLTGKLWPTMFEVRFVPE